MVSDVPILIVRLGHWQDKRERRLLPKAEAMEARWKRGARYLVNRYLVNIINIAGYGSNLLSGACFLAGLRSSGGVKLQHSEHLGGTY